MIYRRLRSIAKFKGSSLLSALYATIPGPGYPKEKKGNRLPFQLHSAVDFMAADIMGDLKTAREPFREIARDFDRSLRMIS